MAYSGLIAKYNLENWYTTTFTPKEKAFIKNMFPMFCLGTYEKVYSAALALATNIIPALDLPNDNYFEYRKINVKVQDKIITKVTMLLEADVPLIEKHIIYNIIIYYIMHHQGIFLDSERAINFSEEQVKISAETSKLISTEKDDYPEFDLEMNYGYETLYKIYNSRNNKDKCLDLIMKVQAENWNIDFGADILSDEGLLNAYCKKTYKKIFEENTHIFIHNAIHTLKYPKTMTPWIEILLVPDSLQFSKFIDMENPIQNLKFYKCYIGMILNSENDIADCFLKVEQLFKENEKLIHERNPREILISLEAKDATFKKKIGTPSCNYCTKQAQFLRRCNFNIDLETIIANYMFDDFDFLQITDAFQKKFDILINSVDKKNFAQKLIDYKSNFIRPKIFTENDVKNYIKENTNKLINNSWHSLLDGLYANEIYETVVTKFTFEDFPTLDSYLDFISKEKEFINEHKIKLPFSDGYEKQHQFFTVISIKKSKKLEQYLKFAKEIFPNHEIIYETEINEMIISLEKDDFNIKEIDESIINAMIKESHDDFVEIKKNNDNAVCADEYIDLATYAEYIFACNFYLIAEYKMEHFEKLKCLLTQIDKNDIQIDVENRSFTQSSKFEIDYSLRDKINFNANTDYLNYLETLRHNFISNYKKINSDNWQFFDFNFLSNEFSNIPFHFEYEADETSNFSLLYDMKSISEIGDFVPRIDASTERETIEKQIQEITLRINLTYISLDNIKEKLNSIFHNQDISLSIKKRTTIVKIPISFTDFEIITEKSKLSKSFDKHLEFVKLAFITNIQCKSETHPEYISDDALLTTIAYNESRFLVGLKTEFYNTLERFYYAIGRENFVWP